MNIAFLYVAIVFAVAVGLARRGGADLPWRMAGLFYGLTLIFFFKPLALDYINVPVDFVFRLPPWIFAFPHRFSTNAEMNDLALQIVPWAHQVREAWRSLHVPLWNGAAGCGYPLLGNGQSAALSPLRLIALPLSLGHSMTAEGAMKVLAALSLAYLFCRKRGYGEVASTVGALSFGFSTFIIYWLHFPLVTAAAFLPAVFYAIEMLLEKQSYPRLLFFVGVWTVLLLGGHPETASHAALFGGAYLIFVLLAERRDDKARLLSGFVATALVGALIALPVIVPFVEGVTKSKRFQVLQVYRSHVPDFDLRAAVLLFQPHFYGDMDEPRWGPAVVEHTTGFAGVFAIAAGMAMLLRLLTGGTWRERETFFILMTPLTLGVALGVPWLSDLFHRLPLFSLAANGRLRLLICWLLAVQAAAVVDLISRGQPTRYLLAGVAAATAMMAGLVWGTHFPPGWAHDNSIAAAIPSLFVLATAAILVLYGGRGRWAAAAVVFAVTAELWSVGIRWNPAVPSGHFYPRTPLIDHIVRLAGSKGMQPPARIVGIAAYFFPNVSAMYGLEDIRVHDPMANGRYMGFLRVVAGYETLTYFSRWEEMRTRLLDYLNVRYVLTFPDAAADDPERFRRVYSSRDGVIFENRDVLPRFFNARNVILEFNQDAFVRRLRDHTSWKDTAIVHDLKVESDQERRDLLQRRPPNAPEATVKIVAADALNPSGPDFRLRVDAPRWSLVVSSEPFWPGWRVIANGKDLSPMQVNGPFLGFVVPPGRSDVRVVYDPIRFKVAAAISLLTIAALVGVMRVISDK